MSRMLAVLLVAVLAAVATTDPLFCPDGCTAAAEATHDADANPTPSDDCWICQPAVSVVPQSIVPPIRPASINDELVVAVVLPSYAPLDRPPRLI